MPDLDTQQNSAAELRRRIVPQRHLKNNKAVGTDCLPGEIFKYWGSKSQSSLSSFSLMCGTYSA